MLGLGLEGSPPQRGGLDAPAQVDQGHRPVVHPVRRPAAALRLAPGVGRAGEGLPCLPQGARDLGQVPGPVVGPLPEAAGEQVAHRLGHRRNVHRGEAAPLILREDLGGGQAVLPGAPAREHLQDGQGEAPQVGAAGQGITAGLLGGEVGGGSAAAALDGHRVATLRPRVQDRSGAPRLALVRAGEAEVGDLGGAVRGHQHVGRLHVAVDQPLLVGVVQPPRRLDGGVEDPLGLREPPLAYGVEEAAPVRQLGEDQGLSEGLADVEAGHHVGVEPQVDPGLGLLLEELGPAGGLEHLGQGGLDREVEPPAPVAHAVDAAHAALAEHSLDLVEPQHDLAGLPVHPGRGRGGSRRGAGDGALPGRGTECAVLGHRGLDGSPLEGGGGRLAGLEGRGRRLVGLEDGRGGFVDHRRCDLHDGGGIGRRCRRRGGGGELGAALAALDGPAGQAGGHLVGAGPAARADDGEEPVGHL